MKNTEKPTGLTAAQREKWEMVYHFARLISAYEPWQFFRETDHFVYADWKHETIVHYRFLADCMQRCGIACYFCDWDYNRATEYLFSNNRKMEPVEHLQNALIGLWGNRKDLSKESYEVVKQLDRRGHGDGSWLYFEKYTEGYLPTVPNDEELDLLGDALGNLYMMMRALIEKSGHPAFPPKACFARWYDPKTEQYYNAFSPAEKARKVPHYQLKITPTPHTVLISRMPKGSFSVSMDWSYLPFTIRENGRDFYPILLLAVSQDGIILEHQAFAPDDPKDQVFVHVIDDLIKHHGKPRQIRVSDPDLWCFVEPLCRVVNIKATKEDRLPVVDRARKMLLEQP